MLFNNAFILLCIFSIVGYMYNCLYYIMEGMKSTSVLMEQSRGDICNRGKYPMSLGTCKNASDFDFI